MIKVKLEKKIKAFRSDNGGEYTSNAFRHYLTKNGIESQTYCLYTPGQNNIPKHNCRHLLEVTRAILFEMNVPKSFWSDEVLTTYLINRMPSKTLGGNSPIEILCPNTPLFQVSPKIYGCMCFVHIPKHHHDKLDPQVEVCFSRIS